MNFCRFEEAGTALWVGGVTPLYGSTTPLTMYETFFPKTKNKQKRKEIQKCSLYQCSQHTPEKKSGGTFQNVRLKASARYKITIVATTVHLSHGEGRVGAGAENDRQKCQTDFMGPISWPISWALIG